MIGMNVKKTKTQRKPVHARKQKRAFAFLNCSGETYIDVAITVMIVAFVLVFSVNMVSLVALNQNMKTMADQIVDYATLQGTTDIGEYISTLKEKSGIDFSCSFSGTDYHSGQKVNMDYIDVD